MEARNDEDTDNRNEQIDEMPKITLTDTAQELNEVAPEVTHPDPEPPTFVTKPDNDTEPRTETESVKQEQQNETEKVNGRLVKSKIVKFNPESNETIPLDATFDHRAAGMPLVEDIPEGFLESLDLEVVDFKSPEPKMKEAGDVEKGKKADGEESKVEDGISENEEKASVASDTESNSDEEEEQEPPSMEYFRNLAKPTPEQISLTSLSTPPPPPPPPSPLLFGPPRPPYIIKFTLLPTQNPAITRTLSVPCELPFSALHHAIQSAFSWSSLHSYFFNILKTPTGTPLQHILDGVGFLAKDQYWARLDAFPELSEEKVVRVIGSKEVRLFQVFERWVEWSVDVGVREERTGRSHHSLEKKVEEERTPVVEYEYDLLLGWIHRIEVVGRGSDPEGYNRVVCLDGEGHPAAEDLEAGLPVSGEWEKLKDIYRLLDKAMAEAEVEGRVVDEKKLLTEEQVMLKFWYERDCMNGDLRGLGDGRVDWWNREGVQRELGKIVIRGLGEVVVEGVKEERKRICCASLADYGGDRRRDEKRGLVEMEDWEKVYGDK